MKTIWLPEFPTVDWRRGKEDGKVENSGTATTDRFFEANFGSPADIQVLKKIWCGALLFSPKFE